MTELAETLRIWHPHSDTPFRFLLLDDSNRSLWAEALERKTYQPVGYHLTHVDYQHVYFASAFPLYRRLDCLIVWENKVIALWPLGLYGQPGTMKLSSHVNGASGVMPPLMTEEISHKLEKSLGRAWIAITATLCRDFSIPDVEFLAPPISGAVPEWHGELMKLGAVFGGQHRLSVDLALPEVEYHKAVRKSYKALINNAAKLWNASIDAVGNGNQFAEFQQLHEQVAGRKTRPESTWQSQFDAVVAQSAFVVYLRDDDGRLVGASLFIQSRDEAYYAVGAYRRELFDQPLAHLSLYEAIRHARSKGLRQFILGLRAFPGDDRPPSEKEEKIAFFKEGFATGLHVQPVLRLNGHQLLKAVPNVNENYSSSGLST